MTPLVDAVPLPVPDDDYEAHRAQLERVWRHRPGVLGWLSATTHQTIGMNYIVTAFAFHISTASAGSPAGRCGFAEAADRRTEATATSVPTKTNSALT